MIPQGTMGDILSNQHLLPVTTEVYRQMTCHVVTHCVMMCVGSESAQRCESRHKREEISVGDGEAVDHMQSPWFV